MAKLFKIAFLLTLNIMLIAANNCECEEEVTPEEREEVWKFLSMESVTDISVLPGELAQLVPCRNCIEQNRRKRKIQEDVIQGFKREERSPTLFHKAWGHQDERNKCPIGFKKLFWRCLKF